MPEPLALVLPWPPASNHYYRSAMIQGKPRVLLSKDGRKYKKAIRASLARAKLPHFGLDRIRLEIEHCAPTAAALDLDGRNKALIDALSDEYKTDKATKRRMLISRGLWCNDAQIDDLHVKRGPLVKEGMSRVTVRVMARVEEQAALVLPDATLCESADGAPF